MSTKNDSLLKNTAVAVTLAFVCQVLWGIVFPIIKKAYALFSIQSVPDTFLFASIRFMVAGIILLLVATLRDKHFPLLKKGTRLPVFLLGSVQTGLVYGLQFAALTRASSINCSIINGMACIFSVLSARILFPSERITPKKTVGILLGFSAILFCFLYQGNGVTSISFLGEGLMFVSVFLFNFAASYSKRITTGVDSMVTAGYNLLIGG
ncbi:MAG: DMT family transporter, partial [Spirochaetales bacterium]|nr:DMT family transporter [Candidatus Physcosoma equi]